MKKTIFITGVFLLFLSCVNIYAQAPKITYSAPATVPVGQPITPIKPAHAGGSVPNLLFSEVKTVAGSGLFGQKDTVASHATFLYVINTATDSKGNIFVADAGANAIRKITPAGVVTTFAGSATGKSGNLAAKDTAARFNFPTGIAIDNADNIYITDCLNNMIRKIAPDGTVTTFAGNINPGWQDGNDINASFTAPQALCFDLNGNLLVADTYSNKVRKITPAGVVTTLVGPGFAGIPGGPEISANLNGPKGIAADKLGNVYITESDTIKTSGVPTGLHNRVRKIDTNNKTISDFASQPLNGPFGITTDARNNVYVSNLRRYNVFRYASNGTRSDPYGAFSGGNLYGGSNGTDTITKYKGNMGLSYNGKGQVIIADAFTALIRKVAVNGYQVYPRLPDGLALDSTGTISGTPTKKIPAAQYKIYAYNDFGVDSTVINLEVAGGTQTINFAPIAAKLYGEADFAAGASSSNLTIPITYTSSDPLVATIVNGKIHVVGVGSTVITAAQASNANYAAATPVSQTLQINKAPLLITADDKIKTINTDNPALTLTFSGFVNGEDVSILTTAPTVATTVTSATVAGKYPITVSGAVAANYQITFKNGTFTVFPIPEIIATGSTTIVKGGSVLLSAVPGANYAYQWYFNGGIITGANAATYAATQTGAYTVSITDNGYTTTSLYIAVTAQLQLPADNFTIKVNGTSCKGTNNGSINLTAKNKLNYSAIVTGNGNTALYNFTDELKLSNLPPGSFNICISVQNEVYNQCFQVYVTEPLDLALYSVVNKAQSTVTLQLDGASRYNINLNDVAYTTSSNQITLPLSEGINKLMVGSDKECQGIIVREIDMGIVQPFPNPFVSSVKVNIGNKVVKIAAVNITDLRNGKTVFQNKYVNASGILEVDLSPLESGIYYLKLNRDNQESGYKIIKK